MSTNEINTQYRNYAASHTVNAKSSSGSNTLDTFKKEISNWQKRIKDSIDKEQENASNGSIQMSEKQWRSLMNKVDSAIDISKDNIKEQDRGGKKQLEEENLIQKDTVAVSSLTDNANIQPLNYFIYSIKR